MIVAGDSIRPEVKRILEYLNSEMTNAEVYGLELQCYGTNSDSLILVPRLIGQTQAIMDRKSSSGSGTQWTADRIREYIEELDDEVLAERWTKTLELALKSGAFARSNSMEPRFNVRSSGGLTLFSFRQDGSFDIYLSADRFERGLRESEEFAAEMKSIGLVNTELKPSEVDACRRSLAKVTDLSDDEFNKFLDIMNRYSCP